MANEAVIINLGPNGGRVMRFTCADGTGIAKGTILKLADPRTVAAATADNDVFAGIAAEEKVASDGQTSIGVYTEGIFDLYVSNSTIPVGSQVSINGANDIKVFTAGDYEDGVAFGKALEASAAGTAEVIAVAIGGILC